MSLSRRLFPTYPGRSAFGVNIPAQNAGDYILQKKSKTSYCNISLCKQQNNIKSQSDLLNLRKSNYLYNKCVSSNFNKYNLNINLFTKLDLKNVPVISNAQTGISPTTLDFPAVTPYLFYNIDKCGILFGNTTCGVNNYENFMIYNPPYDSLHGPHSNYDEGIIKCKENILAMKE